MNSKYKLIFMNSILFQYPVFPWIITDYTSDSIDLNDEKLYRDLTKPVGILNPKKAEEIQVR